MAEEKGKKETLIEMRTRINKENQVKKDKKNIGE